MSKYGRYETACVMAGEFVEQASPPGGAPSRCEIDPTRMVAVYQETAADQPREDQPREFQILLRDNRIVKVRGAALKYVPNPSNPADCGSYAILSPSGNGDTFVAVFRASEVTGIFSGELQSA